MNFILLRILATQRVRPEPAIRSLATLQELGGDARTFQPPESAMRGIETASEQSVLPPQRFVWRFWQALIVFCAALNGSVVVRSAETDSLRCLAIDSREQRVSGTLKQGRSTICFIAESGRLHSLSEFVRLRFRGHGVLSNGPTHRLVLRGGDSLPLEIVSEADSDSSSIPVKIWSNSKKRLPWGAIDRLESLPGEQTILFDDFSMAESDWRVAEGEGRKIEIARVDGAAALRLAGAFRYDSPTFPAWEQGRISFRYHVASTLLKHEICLGMEMTSDNEGKPAETVTVVLNSADGLPRAESTGAERWTHQPLERRDGWEKLTIRLQSNTLQLLLDERLRAYGPAPRGKVQRTCFFSRPSQHTAVGSSSLAGPSDPKGGANVDPAIWIDRFEVVRRAPALPEHRSHSQDRLLFANHDEWFGTLGALSRRSVKFVAADQKMSVPWTEVSGIAFAPRESHGEPIHGSIARLTLATPVDALTPPIGSPSDVLTVAMQSIEGEKLIFTHPWLGKTAAPLAAVRCIEPLWYGTWTLVESERRHLGRRLRSDFRHVEPQGTRFVANFELTPLPAEGSGRLRVAVRDLEPCGPDVPPGSGLLKELRAGFYRTDLFLNDQPIGDLNSRLTWKSSAGVGQDVIIDLPRSALKAGNNRLRCEQRPGPGGIEFDEVEVGPISLELIQPEPGVEE